MNSMNGVGICFSQPPRLQILEGRPFWLADPLQTPSHPRYPLPLLIQMIFLHLSLAVILNSNLTFYLMFLISLIIVEMNNIPLRFHTRFPIIITIRYIMFNFLFCLHITELLFPIIFRYIPILHAYIHMF